jgi:transforming growth factor-beta-induced protein
MFNGGVIHVIDSVLTVPPPPSTAVMSSNLTSLMTGLKMAGLTAPVDSLKDVTIFAPANSAFKAVNAQVSTLTVSQLSTVLQYHVISGTVGYSSLLTTGLANESFPTLAGQTLNIRSEGGKVFVNSAQVTMTDVLVSNGVVHVLDK